jgi:ADP-ribose pyrophosphatase YjhB (NUDIX family)
VSSVSAVAAVSAVSAVVVRDDGRVLLVRRAKAPLEGVLTLPGGRVEPGESPDAAAAREVREETSLDVEVLGLVTTVEVAATATSPRYRIDVMATRLLSDPAAARAASDAASFVWAAVTELEALSVPAVTQAAIAAAQSATRERG